MTGLSIVLPKIASPQKIIRGVVTDFHEVREYRNSYFEFRIDGQEPSLSAFYFDKGFYFGNPLVSNGDTVEVTYLTWTDDVSRISETTDHHPGWMYEEDPRPVGPWILMSAGVFLMFGAIFGKLSDIAARPESEPGLPGRGLG